MTNQFLLVTPAPKEDESFSGYCVRIAELNGYSDWLEFSRSILMTDSKSDKISKALMSRLTGYELTALLADCDGKITQIKDSKILTKHLMTPKICPDCILETGYHRGMHDIKAVTTCVKHRRLLISYCPRCITNISSSRPFLLKCKCSFDLTKVPHKTVTDAELDLQKVIDCIIYGDSLDDSSSVSGMPFNKLLGLSLNTLLIIIESIGMKNLWLDVKKRMQVNYTPQEITKSAAEVFANWPTNFIGFLSQYGDEKTCSYKVTNREWRNEHLSQLGSNYPKKESEFIREQYLNYLINHWPKKRAEKGLNTVLKSSFTDHSSVGLYATIWGANPAWVENEFAINNIHEIRIIKKLNSLKFIIVKNESERLEHTESIYKYDEAAKYLGISLNLFNYLMSSGYLIQNYRTGKFKRCSKPDLDYFLRQLQVGITQDVLPADNFVGFSMACMLKKRFGNFPLFLIIKMLKGEVRIAERFEKIEDALLYGPDVDKFYELLKIDISSQLALFSFERRCVDNDTVTEMQRIGVLEAPITNYDSLLKF
ncbi:MAG TPA: TniQ family protein [Methylophilaceae bacterium]|nr:TniQ family protein [Methylophilaceae bacterium]